MVFTILVGIPYMIKIIFSRYIELKTFEKSKNRRVDGIPSTYRFLDFTPSSIRRMVTIYHVVHLFVRKPFLICPQYRIYIWSYPI